MATSFDSLRMDPASIGEQEPPSPMDGLVSAALHAMRLLRIGPFGSQQRLWQQAMESSGSMLSSQTPLHQAFQKFEQTGRRPQGYTLRCWTNKVVDPALTTVASIWADLHVFSDHPMGVQQGLFQSGLLPMQAAKRIMDSRKSVAAALAKRMATETIQTLRCPVQWKDHAWSQQSAAYIAWQIDVQRGAPQQPVVFPVSNAQWSMDIRRWNLPLRVTLNAQQFDADLQQRLWTLNRVKVIGTLLWHPKVPSINNSLLRNIANIDPNELGIAELAGHLKGEGFETVAGPIVIIEAIEKSSDVSHGELVDAVQALLDALLKVHLAGQKVGTIVWNTLPAPWLYPPQQDELVPDDWAHYERINATVTQALTRLSNGLLKDQGHALTSMYLKWERKR